MDTENQILMLITLVVVLVVALSINYFFYRRQVAEEKRRIAIKKIQGFLPDLLNCLTTLKQSECAPDVTQRLEAYAADQLDELARLAASEDLLNQLNGSRTEARSPSNQGQLDPKLVQQAANKALTVFKTLHSVNKINPQQLERYSQELTVTKMLVEAEALIDLAGGLIGQQKISVAKNYLRQAKSMVSKLPSNDPRCQKLQTALNSRMEEAQPKPIEPITDQPASSPSSAT